jgi:type II secretory pathway component PulF
VRFQNAMPTALVADVLGRLAIALAAGVDPRRAWASESARVPPRYRPALEAASRALAAGGGIADAMQAADGAFPAFVIGMAQVGDETGHQAETLRELASTLRGMVRSSRALRSSLVWPAFQLATALGVVGLLIFLAGVLSDGKGNGIDMLGLGLAGVSGLATYLALLGALALVGVLVQRWALASWRRHGVVRTIAARVPVLGRASAAAEAAAWCRAASLASHAGLSVGRLTTLASSAAPGVRIDAAALEDRLRAGATLAEALRETGRFDDRLLHAVAVGEATGNTAEVLERIAGEFDDESRRGFEAAARGVGFAVWAVVAGLIALVIFRIFSFYVGLIQEAVG